MRSAFHSCYGYFVVSVDTTIYLGLRFEGASEKGFFVISVLALFLKSRKSEVKVNFFFHASIPVIPQELLENKKQLCS